MGYMGFGMQKENYTRKPRKVFEKYKDKFELDRGKESSNPSDEKFERIPFKHFSQTRVFKIAFFFAALFLVTITLWGSIFKEPWHEYQRLRFERDGIAKFYNSLKPELSAILKFASNNNLKVDQLEYQWDDQFLMSLRNGGKLNWSNNVQRWEQQGKNDSIVNGSLKLGSGSTLNIPWRYELQFKAKELKEYKVLNYLNAGREDLAKILPLVKSKSLSLKIDGKTVLIKARHPEFGVYEFIFVDLKNEIVSTPSASYTLRLGCIVPNSVYWRAEY